MTVLLTRPLIDSLELSSQLNHINVPTLIEPMFRVEYFSNHRVAAAIADPSTRAVIFTSKNAAAALSSIPVLSAVALRIFVVGEKTARYVKKLGFINVFFENNVEDLVKSIIQECAHMEGTLIYPRGEIITMDIKAILHSHNITVQEFLIYKTIETTSLSAEVISKLQSKDIKFIVLFSQNTAAILFQLLHKSKAEKYVKDVTILVISSKIQDFINTFTVYNKVRVFKDESTLFEIIRELYDKQERR